MAVSLNQVVIEHSPGVLLPAQKSPLSSKPKAEIPRTAVALIGFVTFWIVVLWSALALPGLEDPACFGILHDKHRILDRAGSPKIVFVGGSNLLFGLDGEQVERELHMKAVNMGLCLMFPLPYLFEEIKANVHKGDIVVLCPEYASYSEEFGNPMSMAEILAYSGERGP